MVCWYPKTSEEILYTHAHTLTSTVRAEISTVCKFCGFHGHLLYSENLIHENFLVCNNLRFVTVHNMLPFHDEPVIRENIIAKILFASCSAKISYRENFRAYGIPIILSITYKLLG